ncbi:MAG: VWA domain-containing protein, partial [Planctomycetes bacterium]|nr:VWA domain-containing protein [Planctomycetota bacterium]
MFDFELPFDSPWYLLLALTLPVLWVVSWRNLSGLGPVRRWFALGVRTIIFLLLVFALAEAYLPRTSDRLTVVYLLDQSESISRSARKVMLDYCRKTVEKHQDRRAGDRVAVIVFGRQAAVEVSPTEGPMALPDQIESLIDAEFSDLEAAMNMAKAMFPEDSAKRIVLISDGSENLGDSRRAARGMAAAGIGIDVVAVPVVGRTDVAIDKISLPTDVRRGQPFEPRVVLSNNTQARQGQSGDVKGKLRIVRRTVDQEQVISESPVTLPPGKTVVTTNVPETLDKPDFYIYEARFVADDPGHDTVEKNNRATAYTQVRGHGQVLLIEDSGAKGQFDHLVDVLRQENLVVTRQSTDQMFTSLADLQRYDTVVLANVPRAGGDDEAAGVTSFSDEQIAMLARNTQQFGAGLVMLGGPNSFGAGGWTNTEVEKALPVDMQIKNYKITPIGALVLVIDRSGSMCGEPLDICKQAAIASIKMLGPQDYVGVIVFDDQPQWVVPLRKNDNPADSIRRVAKVDCGGGTDLLPGMRNAYAKLNTIQTAVKHVIVLTDGQTPQGDHLDMAAKAKKAGITTSSVGAGDGADRALLSGIAREGGGKFYAVKNLKTIPRIFMREARRLATPLIYERQGNPFPVTVDGRHHELTQGMSPPPGITGFVQTTVKENPLVEVSIQSTQPAEPTNRTILASWTYGLGRSVAFTTDAGESNQRWAASWKQWPEYRKFFSRMIRWSMRPIDDTGRFMLATDVEDGRIKVVLSAWDDKDRFLNDLPITGTVVGPDMQPRTMTFQQTAPGRYVGEAPAADSGSYLLAIHPGGGRAPLRSGVSVPYSAEFRDKETNLTLLNELAQLPPA